MNCFSLLLLFNLYICNSWSVEFISGFFKLKGLITSLISLDYSCLRSYSYYRSFSFKLFLLKFLFRNSPWSPLPICKEFSKMTRQLISSTNSSGDLYYCLLIFSCEASAASITYPNVWQQVFISRWVNFKLIMYILHSEFYFI